MKSGIMLLLLFVLAGLSEAQDVGFYRIGSGSVADISPNGQVAAGTDLFTAFYWTEGTGKVLIGEGEAYAVTNDTMVVGRFRDPNTITPGGDPVLVAGYWKNGVWTSIGGLPGVQPFESELYSHAYGVSADGSTIVGMGGYPNYTVEAFYWRIGEGVVPLGQDGNFNSRANDANADGSIIAGWDGLQNGPDRRAYMWDPEPHFLGSFDSTGYPIGEAYGISPSGEYIVGTSNLFPFVWTSEGGMQHLLDPSIYPFGGTAIDVTDDGMVVGGVDISLFNSRAVFIQAGEEVTFLKEYLTERGVEGLEDWTLQWVSGVSADGSVIGGHGTDHEYFTFQDAYVVKFNRPASDVALSVGVDPAWLPVPANGDTIPLDISAANLSDDSLSVVFSIYLTRPDGVVKEVIHAHQLPLGPLESVERVRSIKIHSEGPAGTYSAVIFWGNYRQYSSSFSFEKSSTGVMEARGKKDAELLAPSLGQNSPNPFNPSTRISFTLPEQSHVVLEVFNMIGERVALLADEVRNAGTHHVVFDAANLASGVYVYRLQTPGFMASKRLLLVK
jgi:uncharacterized membrane protein